MKVLVAFTAMMILTAFTGSVGCTNAPSGILPKATSSSTPGTSNIGTNSTAGIVYSITNVTVAASTTTTPIATIFMSASNPTNVISNSCTGSQSPTNLKPCSCQFSWQEVNQTGTNQVPIQHTVLTGVLSVQPNAITCNAPTVYSTEISDNTQLKISIVPSSSNTSAFSVNPFNFLKQSGAATGSFQDVEGKSFDNILRYSCYETTKRSVTVQTKTFSALNSTTGVAARVMYASDFCVKGSSADGCAGLPAPQSTGQAYYYNLYIRNTDRGNINTENTRYRCPLVKEILNSINTSGSQTDYYPLDTSFALSLTSAPDYSIGVEAFSKLGIGSSDPGSAASACSGGTAGSSDTGSLVRSCLGFAAKPASDGTCPLISLPGGQRKNTYRLRRFIALYPPLYDGDGKMIQDTQASDTIYVLDRPVTYAGATPEKPYTMRGPKPCPFAYFDSKGVTDTTPPADAAHYPLGMPAYVATNNPLWNNTNIDGTQFPNNDVAAKSCSSMIPILNDDRTVMSLATVHSSNPVLKRIYVRPVQAWAPHYEEDTDFQACAPQSAPFVKDPPLHFSKDITTGNVNWCAESYPSQNPNVTLLDLKSGGTFPGKVMPYTSHVVKNSASPVCSGTQLTLSAADAAIYPAVPASSNCSPATSVNIATAYHPVNFLIDSLVPQAAACGNGGFLSGGSCYFCASQTCDRTVQNNNATLPFPLLARAPQVESAINADSTYGCTITYDNNGSKTGKKTPTQGCCGNTVNVWTGTSAATANTFNKAAHLEPNADPTVGTLCGPTAY